MKTNSYVIYLYALLILIGGVIGFIKAGSVMSIAMGSGFAAALAATGYYVAQNSYRAIWTSIGLTSFLLLFFILRYSKSLQFMPAGLMTLISLGTLLLLVSRTLELSKSK